MTLSPPITGALLVFADLVLDPSAFAVTRAGRDVPVTLSEFRMLHALMARPGRVLSRDQLYAAAWGGARFVGPRAVDMAVLRLRARLEAGGSPRLVQTVRGVGFVLRESRRDGAS